jgi:AraC family transcriptional regulator of adaptative response/methylated-DNA-[protein]-cysteine methyltransferase
MQPTHSDDYARIEAAIHYVDEHFLEQPTLAEIAAHAGLSESHFQRLFTRWAGISPKRFLQAITAGYARELLRDSTVLDAAYAAGLSSPGRLHDLTVTIHAMTPGEIRAGGEGLQIAWAFHDTPFGEVLAGATGRGVCWMAFVEPEGRESALAALKAEWPAAAYIEDASPTAAAVGQAFEGLAGGPVALHVSGSNFQVRVWEALLGIAPGTVQAYDDIANRIDNPGAVRAVGSALGRNPVAYLIPCHRVIRKTGAFGGYRWGTARKRAILAWESARHAEPA